MTEAGKPLQCFNVYAPDGGTASPLFCPLVSHHLPLCSSPQPLPPPSLQPSLKALFHILYLYVHLLNLFLLPPYNHHSKHYSTYSTSMLISTTSYALLPYNHHSKHHTLCLSVDLHNLFLPPSISTPPPPPLPTTYSPDRHYTVHKFCGEPGRPTTSACCYVDLHHH